MYVYKNENEQIKYVYTSSWTAELWMNIPLYINW